MSEPKHPLKPGELGALYPQAKTYDELQADRVAIRKLRSSWQPKHPKLLIATIILTLCITLWGILEFILPIMLINPMFAVPTGILLGVAWLYALVSSARKIRKLLNQIALSYDDQSREDASRDQR